MLIQNTTTLDVSNALYAANKAFKAQHKNWDINACIAHAVENELTGGRSTLCLRPCGNEDYSAVLEISTFGNNGGFMQNWSVLFVMPTQAEIIAMFS